MDQTIISRFRNNYVGFFRAYSFFVVIAILGVLADTISTISFMQTRGPEAEAHPVIRQLSWQYGIVYGPLIAGFLKIIIGTVVSIYCRRFARYILLALAIVSFWAAWYNLWGWQVYRPMIFDILAIE